MEVAPAVASQFQSSGGSTMPHTLPWLYSATPIRKYLPSFPRGKQFATRPEALPPPGRLPNNTGVSRGNASVERNPQPCGLTTSVRHSSEKGCLRSRLVTITGISTRNRVQRRVDLGVTISIGNLLGRGRSCPNALL